jgi:Mg2+ and Co2+ transporter CorA
MEKAGLKPSTISTDLKNEIDPKKDIRDKVNLVLPDSLMIVLAFFMIPVVLIPIFFDLPASLDVTFRFVDYSILAIFVLEYFLKLALAKNVLQHFLNPWHLLDLLVVLLPLVAILPSVTGEFGYSPLLRLLRIIRIAAVGGRTIDRRLQLASSGKIDQKVERTPLTIRVMDGTLENIFENVSIEEMRKHASNKTETWIDISSVCDEDLDRISESLNIPRMILESELIEESYPRIDYFDNYSMIFALVADVTSPTADSERPSINRTGLLVVCQDQNIITISKSHDGLFKLILEKAKKIHNADEPMIVSILYTLLRFILDQDKQIIAFLEKELMRLEAIPSKDRPDNFLETTFYLRKEVNQLVPSLLHLKELISVISLKRVPLAGFSEKHARIFDILLDEAVYLHGTASNARDNLLSLIDLFINTTSFEMNKVMRVIAVITSLSIIPAVFGLLGSNISGNPWDIQLWQVFGVVAVTMLFLGWVFYRLGWLKG